MFVWGSEPAEICLPNRVSVKPRNARGAARLWQSATVLTRNIKARFRPKLRKTKLGVSLRLQSFLFCFVDRTVGMMGGRVNGIKFEFLVA